MSDEGNRGPQEERASIANQVGRIDAKLDALKENVDDVRDSTRAINGRVRGIEKGQSYLKGGVAVVGLCIPFALFLVQQIAH